MKGFFGIINLGKGFISNSKELFLGNYPELVGFKKIGSDKIFLTGKNPDFPPVTLD